MVCPAGAPSVRSSACESADRTSDRLTLSVAGAERGSCGRNEADDVIEWYSEYDAKGQTFLSRHTLSLANVRKRVSVPVGRSRAGRLSCSLRRLARTPSLRAGQHARLEGIRAAMQERHRGRPEDPADPRPRRGRERLAALVVRRRPCGPSPSGTASAASTAGRPSSSRGYSRVSAASHWAYERHSGSWVQSYSMRYSGNRRPIDE